MKLVLIAQGSPSQRPTVGSAGDLCRIQVGRQGITA